MLMMLDWCFLSNCFQFLIDYPPILLIMGKIVFTFPAVNTLINLMITKLQISFPLQWTVIDSCFSSAAKSISSYYQANTSSSCVLFPSFVSKLFANVCRAMFVVPPTFEYQV